MTDEAKAEEYLKKNKISNNENWEVGGTYCYALTKQAYLDGLAEGRAELKEKHESNKRALKLIIEKGVKLEKEIEGLSNSVTELTNTKTELENRVTELKEQIEKMKCFIHSKIDFCMYCPLTHECKNEEGTCPYAYATEVEQKNLLMDFMQKWECNE